MSLSKGSRSDSSMTCWVPTLLARRRPVRIQRRMVSGSFPARLAASGTVIIARYYYIRPAVLQGSGHVAQGASIGSPRADRYRWEWRTRPPFVRQGGLIVGTRLKKLEDQTIVIAGATSGIGLTTARMAAKRGAKLVLAARSEDSLH